MLCAEWAGHRLGDSCAAVARDASWWSANALTRAHTKIGVLLSGNPRAQDQSRVLSSLQDACQLHGSAKKMSSLTGYNKNLR